MVTGSLNPVFDDKGHFSIAIFGATAPSASDTLLFIPPAGRRLRITYAHGNLLTGTAGAGTTRYKFFTYTYFPNQSGAGFGDGNMLFLLDAVLNFSAVTNSVTGGPSTIGTGFLENIAGQSAPVMMGNMPLESGTQTVWESAFIENTEDMAVALHTSCIQSGMAEQNGFLSGDTYNMMLIGYMV